jgi:Dihydrofolate reductase
MTKLRVNCFSVSIDGYGAGPGQALEHPMGIGGMPLHEWVFPTRFFQAMIGKDGGTTGIDEDFARAAWRGSAPGSSAATCSGPIRGPWTDDQWKGWWGDNPPYHTPVFVLTHHARPPIEMAGGTTFHFVTDGIEAALRRAKDAAGARDVRVGGGPATIRQYLKAGLVDEMHLAISPVLLGRGESLLAGIDLPKLGYRCTEHISSPAAMHVVLARS